MRTRRAQVYRQKRTGKTVLGQRLIEALRWTAEDLGIDGYLTYAKDRGRVTLGPFASKQEYEAALAESRGKA